MKFPLPLGLVLAISLSAVQAMSAAARSPSPSPSPSPTASSSPSPRPLVLPIPSAAPTRAPESRGAPPFPVPPPQPEKKGIPPILPNAERPSTAPSQLTVQRNTPQVEIWRSGSNNPQRPARLGRNTEGALVASNEAVLLRLQFHPSAAGKPVIVMATRGLVLDSSARVLSVQPVGECVVSLRMDEAARHGHIVFFCEGITTTVPFSRVSPERVAARENANGGGGQ